MRTRSRRLVTYASIGFALSAPGQTAGISVFVDHLIADVSLSRSAVSGAYLIGTVIGALALPGVGILLDRHGVRRIGSYLAVGFGLALIGMAAAQGMITVVIGFTGIRMLGQGGLPLAFATAVTRAFESARGAALGIFTALGEGGISLAPVALLFVINSFGWRIAWVVTAIITWALTFPLARAMDDEDVPRRSSGIEVNQPSTESALNGIRGDGWTLKESMRTLMFWAIAGAVGTVGLTGTGLAFHQISLLGEKGLSPQAAAAIFIPQTVASIGATLLVGWLVDRANPRVLLGGSMLLQALALLLAHVATPGVWAISYGIALGLALGAISSHQAILAEYYGLINIGSIRGVVMATAIAGSGFGPFLLGAGFDVYRTYGVLLNLLLILPAMFLVMLMVAAIPSPHRLVKMRTEHA